MLIISPNSLLLGLYLRKKSSPELCGWAPLLGSVSRHCPPLVLCGWALFCVQALSQKRAGRTHWAFLNSVAGLRGWALCPGGSVSRRPCPLVPLNLEAGDLKSNVERLERP